MELLPLPFPRVGAAGAIPDYNSDRGSRLPMDASASNLLVDAYEGERDAEGRCVAVVCCGGGECGAIHAPRAV
jgi:hypothetical protein